MIRNEVKTENDLEIRREGGVIRLILKIPCSRCVRTEKHLTRRVDTPALEFGGLEDILVVEAAEAAAASVKCVLHLEFCHETSDFIYPRIVVVHQEKIYHFLMHLLRDVARMSPIAFLIQEGEDMDSHPQPFVLCRDVVDSDGAGHVVQPKLMKEVDIVSGSIGVLFI